MELRILLFASLVVSTVSSPIPPEQSGNEDNASADVFFNAECGVHSNEYESRISTTGSCYRVSTVDATWKEAHSKCQAEGAHLVILNSPQELEVLYNMLKDKPHNSETQYYAGVTADATAASREFRTVLNQTLEEVGYGPWEENEPNDWQSGENCVVLDTRRHGKYNDVWCHVSMPYVCEISPEIPVPSSTPSNDDQQVSAVSSPIPAEQSGDEDNASTGAYYNAECGVHSNEYESRISTTGSCYRVSTVDATWKEAHAKCQAEGAHLVILNSPKELEVLYNMLKDKPHDSETQYYAGVTADATAASRVFKTVLNQTLEEVGYGPWEENEPNDWQSGENCVVLDTRRHGKYNDVWCHVRMPYVCEISVAPSKTPSNAPAVSKQYRPDYVYNKKTDAFYKLHAEGDGKFYASETCRKEGAVLAKITSDEDLKQIHAMMKDLEDLEDYVKVASDGTECNVVNRKGKIETTTCSQELPFVCKVAAKDAPYSEECGVYSNDYVSKIATTGSCYKVSTAQATWKEAYANCQAEGAHLVILSSDTELKVLYSMLQDKPHDSETQYFAGVRADTTTEPRMFKTVLNQTLEQVGYGPWEDDEPNDWHGGENCVVLDTRRHGKYNDVWCHVRMPYVCESSVRAPLETHVTPSSTPSSVSEPVSSPVPTSPSKQYRPDYEYHENTDAFYKLHTDGVSNEYASEKCIEEGAELAKITSDEDLKKIHAMMKKLSDLEDYVMVATEENSEYDNRYGYLINVVNRRGKIEKTSGYQELPFVCKVAAKNAHYNEECGVYSKGYVSKVSTTGSCYRVSTDRVTWNEAHASCQAEGSHLVILSSDKELEVLYNMLQDQPQDSETQYFAGVRADATTERRVFKTVLNETLEEVGYGPWDEGEPNDYGGGENCVALDMRRHGKYNDVWCHVRMPYVCESSVRAPLEIREPSTPSSDVVQVSDSVSPQSPSKQYLPGYEYNEKTDAFYKLHTVGAGRWSAEKKCIKEGAELVKITSDEDIKQVQAMKEKFLDPEARVMVASGVYKGQGTEINAKRNVVDRNGEIDTEIDISHRPYVCKVAANDVPPYNVECGVYSNDYESRISTTGSCYRVSTDFATWDEAHASCQAEGAQLVVLNNAEELEILYNLLKDKPHNSETQYFAGVTADRTNGPRVFKTVYNKTLEEVGYGPWEKDEPNDYIRAENCVALDTRRSGKYNDVWCDVQMQYVCESSPAPLEVPLNIGSNSVSSLPVKIKQYRPDYEYNVNTDAFYKLHTEGASKYYASEKCIKEGAELVQLTSDEDSKQVLAMMTKLSDLEDYVMVESSVNAVYSSRNDYECNVMNRRGKIETTSANQELPFVCKVGAAKAPYDTECDVFSNDYESKISTTGSCYRVSTAEATWKEAYADCQAEGAHLVILSSDKELEVLYSMLQDKPHDSETQYFAGVRADTTTEPRVFKTVLNQTLEETGYGPWDVGEPNDWHGGENCVALDMRRHGKYNDVWCHVRMPYVCETTPEIAVPSSTPSNDAQQVPDPVPSPLPAKQYRPDYEYNEKTDAFYKLHTVDVSKSLASKKCVAEGAELAEITSDEDLKQIQAMIKKIPDLDFVTVASGVYKGRGSRNDQKMNVVTRKGEIETINSFIYRSFVCKVTARDVQIHEECRVFSNDYESRISTTGSCYRVSTIKATWEEAYANCQAEGAHLVILSSDKELEVLNNMLQDKPHDSETQYFAGVRADTTTEPRVFKTVLNQTLEEAGYGPWDEGEPNDWNSGENCVVLDTRRHGKYNDVWCHVSMPYVCEISPEIPVPPSTPSNDDRQVSDPVSSPLPTKQFRPDYEYNAKTDAFYKLHTLDISKSRASEKCIEEGAELAKITSDEDLKQIQAMIKKIPDLDSVTVASGVYKGRGTQNDHKMNVVTREGEIETINSFIYRSFVCKVTASDVQVNEECGVFSNGYKSRISTTGSCYRVSTIKATWEEAYANCQAEGAHLVILSSDKELEVLNNMLQDNLHDYEALFFAGVRADTTTEQRVFKTVLNQTLEEAGYGPWGKGQPNDLNSGENCVVLDTRRHGKYNHVWCEIELLYVCEISPEIPVPSSTPSNDDRQVIDPVSSPLPAKQYRLDYEYNENTDAFYKLHTDGVSKWLASKKCIEEGAELAKITSDEDLKQIQAMMKNNPDLGDSDVMVAPRDFGPYKGRQVSKGRHVSKGYAIHDSDDYCKVVTSDGKISTRHAYADRPFVCKVAAIDAPINKECGVFSNDYESRISTTGSCYKVYNEVALTWNEAYASCQAEGAHLVILDNAEEHEVLYNMLQHEQHDPETQYYAGVRAVTFTEPRVFMTTLNQTLKEGHELWDESEPNDYEGGENCVALDTRRHGKYNDVPCHRRMPYVCESSGLPRKTAGPPGAAAIIETGLSYGTNVLLPPYSLFTPYLEPAGQ